MADLTIKRGDTRPVLGAQLTDNASPLNLTTATAVKMLMRLPAGPSPKVEAACTITNASTGTITYTWQTGDTDTVGLYNVEFEITWNDGGIQTVPNGTPTGATGPYYTVEIVADLD